MTPRTDTEDMTDAQGEAPTVPLPCPFCGGEAVVLEGEECAWVQCLDMKMHRAMFVDGDNNAAAEALEQWNRRADLARPSQAEDESVAIATAALKKIVGIDSYIDATIRSGSTERVVDHGPCAKVARAALAAMDTPKGGGDE